MVETRTRVPVSATVQATVAAPHLVAVEVGARAQQDAVVHGGVAELVRSRSLGRPGPNRTALGSPVSRRSETVVSTTPFRLAGSMQAGQGQQCSVPLTVPFGEGSVRGQLIRQRYLVRVRLQLSDSDDVLTESALWLPGAPMVSLPDETLAVGTGGPTVLCFESLSSRRISGGVPVTGSIGVDPVAARGARGLRVELVMLEHVVPTAGEPLQDDRTASTVVASVGMAGSPKLDTGRSLHAPFTLPVPQRLPAPSMTTPEFTVRWFLRAVLERPMRPDARGALVMTATTL